MKGQIFSPGKLLITSEYVVLDGALALAVPTQLGQEFFYEEILNGNSLIYWKAYRQNKPWLSVIINYKTWSVLQSNNPEAAEFVLKVLKNVHQLNKDLFSSNNNFDLRTNLQFPSNYGLGSSSTLMNNLAEWAKIDAFQLNEISLGGSGYDVAVAKEKSALLYQNLPSKKIEKICFEPSFKEDLLFVHLNKKQDSREGIKLYRSKNKSSQLINEFSTITHEVLKTNDLERFSYLMTLHEQKLSQFLGLSTVKEKYFKEYGGFVKSLGAWGGDFVMTSKFGDFESYFFERGYTNLYTWDELIR